MMVYEQRASTILYNIFISQDNDKTFLVPSNCCPIVVAVLLKAKKKFELIDISNETLCIDENTVLSLIKNDPSKYAGILFIRSYGINQSFEDFFLSIKNVNNDILIIDDKCLAFPSFDEEPIYADIHLYSTGYSKYVDLGWGGYANLKNGINYIHHDLAYNPEHLSLLNRSFQNAIDKNEEFNFELIKTDWLDTTHPAYSFDEYKRLIVQSFSESRALKNKFNSFYSSTLPYEIQLGANSQNWRFNIVVPQKQILLESIFKEGLFASSHYTPASKIFYNKKSSNADRLYSTIINLFTDKYFDFKNAQKMVEIIDKHLMLHK